MNEAADVLVQSAKQCDHHEPAMRIQLLSLVSEMLERAERKFEAIEFRRYLAQLEPQNQDNLFQLSVLLGGAGEIDEALAYCRQLVLSNREHLAAAANFLLYMNYSDRYSAAEVSNEHFRVGMRFTTQPIRIPVRVRASGERIRIGYLGSDFYTHPVGKIILPILKAHDRSRFDISIYHDGKKSDRNTELIKNAVDELCVIHGQDDDRVASTIREGHRFEIDFEIWKSIRRRVSARPFSQGVCGSRHRSAPTGISYPGGIVGSAFNDIEVS